MLFSPALVAAAPSQISYEYSVLKGGIRHRYGLEVNSSGALSYLHAVEKGEPKKVDLGVDRAFSEKIFTAYKTLKSAGKPRVACGAHRFGTLKVIQAGGDEHTYDLYDTKWLTTYSMLARLFEMRLSPLSPRPIIADCISLEAPPKIEVLRKPGEYERFYDTSQAHSPRGHFTSYVTGTTEEQQVDALAKIVRTKGSDPFFAKYLIKTYKYSFDSKQILKYHLAPVVFSVADRREAGELIKRIARGKSLERKYFITMLYLLRYEFEKAAAAAKVYFSGLGRHAEGERESKRILSAREAIARLNYGKTTWSRQIHTVGFLFEFWHDWARRIEAPQNITFTLARKFYERTFHYAHMYAGDLKVGAIPSTPKGRAFLKLFLPIIAKHLWWTLYPQIQNDIVQTITSFRVMPKLFGGVKEVEKLIPSLNKRIEELTMMRRFRAATELMEKYAGSASPAQMKYAMGRALYEQEHFEEAYGYLKEAQDSGRPDVTRMTVLAALHLGRTDLAEPPAEAEESVGRIEWFVTQGLFSLGHDLIQSLGKAKLSRSARLWIVKFKLGTGMEGAYDELVSLTRGDDLTAHKARLLTAELHLATQSGFEQIYSDVALSLYGPLAARAWALLACAASQKDATAGRPFLEKGGEVAATKPQQWLSFLDILVRYGVYPAESYVYSEEAFAHFQRSSHLAWLRAALFMRAARPQRALHEIERALSVQPNNTKYLKLKTIIRTALKKE